MDVRIVSVVLTAALASLALAARAVPALSVAIAARSIQPGELTLLTLTTGRPASAVRVRAFDREVPAVRTSASAWQAIVGIDLDVKPGRYVVSFETSGGGAPESTTYDLIVRAKSFPTRVLTVDPAFVNPPADVMPRVLQDAADLAACWAHSAPERLWTEPFVRPVPQPANSAFGTRSVFNGQPKSPHGGADFLSPAGTPIAAPNAGRVVIARDLYYTGNTVVIDHGLGLFSLLAHMSAIEVHDGDRVAAGDIVGRVGATGRVTGPHLHWTVRVDGARVDPLSLLAVLGADTSR